MTDKTVGLLKSVTVQVPRLALDAVLNEARDRGCLPFIQGVESREADMWVIRVDAPDNEASYPLGEFTYWFTLNADRLLQYAVTS